MRYDRDALMAHAEGWIAAWNAHDVEAVLKVWAEDGVFTSPAAASLTGSAQVRGKSALRDYWGAALACVPDLRFELIGAFADEPSQVLIVHYVSYTAGRAVRAAEILVFEQGAQVRGEAFYGAVVIADTSLVRETAI
ncbi:MAG: hypothetical protein CVT79_08160 [Alphaproteobacteria bacterium HGW-Alphaproteobacteria-18]|nr:MAG: hypothetical protein CVT79_08160 [Alphaproteobacteria bacterium HGW-Alphaproteobacteria-18]